MPQQESSKSPAIRLFQFDQDGIGAIKNSVNLFRGDVNLPLNLFSLKGRNDLDVDIRLLGQSNIQDQVDRWSLDAPTSVAGLGWTFPLERIEADVKNTGSTVFNDYYLVADESRELLKPNTARWQRLTLPTSLASELNAGGTASTNVRAQFADANIALSSDAAVTVVQADKSWTISCPTLEEVFNIEAGDNILNGYDGGQSFETKSFQFWRIRHYANFEKWAITRDNGITHVYGGGVAGSGDSPKTSSGNSVAWSVRWGNWLGSSSLVDNADGSFAQTQYATSWYLSKATTIWGDTVTYDYEVTTQQLGSDKGLPYTKATYLSQITDVFGRTVNFNYKDKLHGQSSPTGSACDGDTLPDGIREYMDPHRPTPSNTPNAYQDRYETKFLDSVDATNHEGDKLFRIQLGYCLQNVSVHGSSDPLYLDTFKRYLTSMTLENVHAESLPGMEFTYNWATDTDTHRGALSGLTYPEGGAISYDYEKVTLDQLDREVKVQNPFPGINASPRIFFGTDYTVVTWYRPGDNAELQVQVWSWLAGWYNSDATTFSFNNKVDINSIKVIPQNDFFTLSFFDASKEKHRLYLYHKDIRALGQWLDYAPITNDFGDADNPPQVAAGEHFAIVTHRDSHNHFHVDRFTWERQQDDDQICRQTDPLPNAYGWTESQDVQDLCQTGVEDDARFFATAHRNYYAILCYDSSDRGRNRLQLFYQDSLGNWFDGPVATPNFALAPIPGADFYANLAPADTFLALAVITAWQAGSPNYKTFIFEWEEWNGTDTALQTVEDIEHFSTFLSLGPQVSNDSLIGFGPNVRRTNGDFEAGKDGWLKQGFDMKLLSSDANHWFATGPNYGLKSDFKGFSGLNVQLAPFDPNSDISSWGTDVQTLIASNDPSGGTRSNFITAGGEDYFTFDVGVYFRNQSTDWSDAQQNHRLSTVLGEGLRSGEVVDTLTIQNQAPSFIAYPVVTNQGPIRTEVIYLRNGCFVSDTPQRLADGEVLFQTVSMSGSNAKHVNGKLPAGPSAFYTYPVSQGLNGAQHITLYRYAQEGVTGGLTDFRVKSLTISDGFGADRVTQYQYVDETAGYDPSGTVAKYFEVTVSPGSDPSTRTYGYSVSRYLNGLPSNFHAPATQELLEGVLATSAGAGDYNQVYSMLDGLLYSQTSYDASDQMIQEARSGWSVFPCIDTPDGSRALYGTWVRETHKSATLDGVVNTSSIAVDRSSGQPSVTQTSAYGADNQERTQSQEILYGHTVYPWQVWNNVVTANIQSKTSLGSQTTSCSAFPYQAWQRANPEDPSLPLTVWAQAAEYAWRGGSETPTFDFDTWTPASPLPDWVRNNLNLLLTRHGQVTESEDATGMVNTILYGSEDLQSVATFHNASADQDEADYYGFEHYEENPGWQLGNGAAVEQGEAHAGSWGARLSAGAAQGALKRTLTPTRTDRPYLFSCWYHTEQGFTAAPGSGWTITVLQGSTPVGDVLKPQFEVSDDGWSYLHQIIDLSTYPQGQALTVKLEASNAASKTVWVDDLMFSPLVGLGTAQVYDPLFRTTIARVGPSNQAQYSVFDRFHREVAGVGPEGNVKIFKVPYMSRQANNVFDAAEPNAVWEISPTGDGFYQDFRRDPDFTQRWSGSGWSIVDGTLQGSGSLSLKGGAQSNFGLRLQAEPTGTLPSFELSVGPTQIEWSAQSSSWTLNGGKTVKASGFAPDLLLMVSGKTLTFLADGQRIFSWVDSSDLSGTLSISAGGTVQLSDVLFFSTPRIGVSYSDATGQDRQRQAQNGSVFQVQETLFDEIGRAAVETKTGSFTATPSSDDLLAYRSGFVDSLDWTTGVMIGEITDQNPSDEGYPYSRSLFEAAPTGRVIERGLPGKTYAIDLRLSSSDRHTAKMSYSNNQAVSFPPPDKLPLTEGQFRIQTATDANGRVSRQVSNSLGDSIANGLELADTGEVALSGQFESIDDQGRLTTSLRLPGYYETPALPEHENYVRTQITNTLSQVTQVSDPDTQSDLRMIYDDLGRLRFLQDANGAAGIGVGQPYALYVQYDAVGRTLEKGWFPVSWGDGSALQQKAQTDPSYPTNGTWARKSIYDGDGTDADALGRLSSTESANHDLETGTSSQVDESFQYDICGNIRLTRLAADAWENGDQQFVAYAYDNTNTVTGVTYLTDGNAAPTASSLQIAYGYDAFGQMTSVDKVDDQGLTPLGQFGFDAQGRLSSESYAPGQAGALFGSRCYNSPGWLTDINVVPGNGPTAQCADSNNTVFSEHLTYISGGYQDAGFFNQVIASAQARFPTLAASPPPGFFAEPKQQFDYDSFYRIRTSELSEAGSTVPAWSLGLGSDPLAYDDNGNLRAFNLGNAASTWAYEDGTDRLCNTTGTACSSTPSQNAFQYDPNGNVTVAQPRGLSHLIYDPMSQRVTGIAGESEPLSFQYGSRNQRILKTGSSTTLYIHGVQSNPLIEKTNPGSGETVKFYIYGPTGLMTVINGTDTHTVIKDHSGSTRAVFDQTGTLAAAYNYLPFGAPMGSFYEPKGRPVTYLYTGQELDLETGLYNFKARMFDPALGRFYGPDPAKQANSPFILGFDDPLLFTDPSGMWSWAAFGMALAGIAIAAVGVVAIVATAGAASPVVAGAEAGLISIGVGAEAAATIATGVGAAVALGGSTALGAGANGAIYAATAGDDATLSGWNKAMQSGAVSGAITGGFAGLGAAATGLAEGIQATSRAAQVGKFLLKGGIEIGQGVAAGASQGAASSAVLGGDVGHDAGTGALTGLVTSTLNFGIGAAAGTPKRLETIKRMRKGGATMGQLAKPLAAVAVTSAGASAAAGLVNAGIESSRGEEHFIQQAGKDVARGVVLSGFNFAGTTLAKTRWANGTSPSQQLIQAQNDPNYGATELTVFNGD